MRYLITGGSGFIGTHLVRNLLSDPDTEYVHILDLLPPKIEHPRLGQTIADICSSEISLPGPFDVCFHLAALCKEPGYLWDEYFHTNAEGTRNLCHAFDRCEIRSVIFTSTMMVYRAQDNAMRETSLNSPDTAYGMSKLLAEQELHAWRLRDTGRSVRIARPGIVFGKGECGNMTRLYRALKRHSFAFVGRKNTVKGCVYIKDVVRALQFLRHHQAELITYNLAIPEPTTIGHICDTMRRVFPLRAYPIPTIPYSAALTIGYAGELASRLGVRTSIHHRRIQKLYRSTHLDCSKILEDGFTFQYPLATALEDWWNECAPGDLE